MINEQRWISSINRKNTETAESFNQINHNRWINTISKKNTYNSVKKYFIMGTLFISGLLLVLVVKNETKNLQKEINILEASVNVIKYNLDQAILDNEVITSPENISLLAKEYLNSDLKPYKRSQIQNINNKSETLKETDINKANLTKNIKSEISKRVSEKKREIEKIKQFYSNPKSIPTVAKVQVAKSLKNKKTLLKNAYESPKDIFDPARIQKWGVVQLVKLFLGIPVVPGR